MSEGNSFSIINLDGASDVIIRLLDMIEKAVGWTIIPKGSKADFEEGLAVYKEFIIKDNSISGIEKGVKISNARKELKQYINQCKIISYAAEDIKDDAEMNIEDDWLMYFFEYAKNITNDDIQRIWGRILAEKCNGNTSINRKLINVLSTLDAESASVFGELCSIAITSLNIYHYTYDGFDCIPVYGIKPLMLYDFMLESNSDLIDSYEDIITKFQQFAILKEIGLIEICSGDENKKYKKVDSFSFMFSNKEYSMERKDKKMRYVELDFGHIKFTVIGETLYNILKINPFPCFDIIIEKYFGRLGYVIDND